MKRKDRIWLWLDKNCQSSENTTLLESLHLLQINIEQFSDHHTLLSRIEELAVHNPAPSFKVSVMCSSSLEPAAYQILEKNPNI